MNMSVTLLFKPSQLFWHIQSNLAKGAFTDGITISWTCCLIQNGEAGLESTFLLQQMYSFSSSFVIIHCKLQNLGTKLKPFCSSWNYKNCKFKTLKCEGNDIFSYLFFFFFSLQNVYSKMLISGEKYRYT